LIGVERREALELWMRLVFVQVEYLATRCLWADLMRRRFGFDVPACPRCGGRLRVIALIEPAPVIERIRRHLGVPTATPARRRSPREAPTGLVGMTTPRCSTPVPERRPHVGVVEVCPAARSQAPNEARTRPFALVFLVDSPRVSPYNARSTRRDDRMICATRKRKWVCRKRGTGVGGCVVMTG